MLKDFIAYLESRVGKSPYVWGGQGQAFKSYDELFAFIERHETTATSKVRALAYAKKLQAAGVPIEDIRVFDCSGLGMYWLQNVKKIYGYDMSANSMYGKCTPIKKSQLKVGDWVFRGGSGRKYHIGYVVENRIGTLYVVEAKGRDDGTVKRTINASGSTYWNAFGRPNVFKNEIENGKVVDEEVIGKGFTGAIVEQIQSALIFAGYSLPKYGADGDYGTETETAVKAFQTANGLKVTGVVDAATFGKLLDVMRTKPSGEVAALKNTISTLNSKISAAKSALS